MFEPERKYKFRDPVHGFIYVSKEENDIVDSLPFQRLRNIKQLALSYYVYHGAEHTRFGHSLGVLHLATRAFRSAVSKGRYQFAADKEENRKKIIWLEQILRLIALTHDLGHAPFSHAAEGLFPIKAEAKGKNRYKHEDLTERIILQTEIAEIISKIGIKFRDEYGDSYDITPKMICEIYSGRLPGERSEFVFLRTLMDSELDCDKMDYLLRDSLFCGVSYGRFDVERLISCLAISERTEDTPILCIESGGVQAFEEFVLARYFMFVQVYFHRTRRYFDIILSKALSIVLPESVFPVDVVEYLQWDDSKVIELLKDLSKNDDTAKRIIERRPWTCLYSTKPHPEGDGLSFFNGIKKSLIKAFGMDNFDKHFLIDTSADKLPHKIIPRKHYLDDEENIAIVNDRTGKYSTISDESHIINNLTERINIQRIYVDDVFCESAIELIEPLVS